MADNDQSIGQDLLNIPLGDMIRSIAMAIADAQFQLDKSSIIMAEFMSGQRILRNPDTGMPIDPQGRNADRPTMIDSRVYFGYTIDANNNRVPQKLSMLELGFVPNFYQFVDTVIEMKIALRVNKSSGPGGGTVITSTPVDAGYAASYNYSAEMACVFKTKLVPIPPPASLEERLRGLLVENRAMDAQPLPGNALPAPTNSTLPGGTQTPGTPPQQQS